MLNAHIASEIIFLHRTFFCIAKNNEKRIKGKKYSPYPESVAEYLNGRNVQYPLDITTIK